MTVAQHLFALRTRSRSLIFAPEFKFSRTRRPSLSGSLWSGINFSGRSNLIIHCSFGLHLFELGKRQL